MKSSNPVFFERWNVGKAQQTRPAPTLKVSQYSSKSVNARAEQVGIVPSHQGSSAAGALPVVLAVTDPVVQPQIT